MKTDFQAIVDGISAMSCIVSIEILPDGKAGKYRIVTGNKAYIDSLNVFPEQCYSMYPLHFSENTLLHMDHKLCRKKEKGKQLVLHI